jgi:hypothetical protein
MLCRTQRKHSVRYTIESGCVKSETELKHSIRFYTITCALLIQCCAEQNSNIQSDIKIESDCVKIKTELKHSIRFYTITCALLIQCCAEQNSNIQSTIQ